MKIIRLLWLSMLLITSTAHAQTTTSLHWLEAIGGPSTFETVYGLDSDSLGYHYFSGEFIGSIDLGTGTLTSAGNQDIYVVKADGSGQTAWATQFAGAGIDHAVQLVYNAGFVYVLGDFQQTLTVGGFTLVPQGPQDFFVAQLDASNGNVVWAQRGGGSGTDRGYDLAVNNTHVAITAGCFGSYTFGSIAETSFYPGGRDVLVATLDLNGNTVANAHIGANTSGQNTANWGVTIDKLNNVYVAGHWSDSLWVDTVHFTNTAPNFPNGMMAGFDASGTVMWHRNIVASTYLYNIELWRDSILLLPMYRQGFYSIGGTAIPQGFSLLSFHLNNAFIGVNGIMASLGGAGDAYHISVRDTSIFMAGGFYGDIDLQGTTLTSVGASSFSSNPIAFRLDTSFVAHEIYHLKSASSGACYNITADTSENVLVCGDFIGSLYHPGDTIVSSGFNDGFIAKFVNCPPYSNGFSVVGNMPYCTGDTLTLQPASLAPQIDYHWYASGVEVSTDAALSITSTGSYMLITDSLGCRDTTATQTITIATPPAFSSNLPSAVCNTVAVFNIAASPAPGYWTGTGSDSAGTIEPATLPVGDYVYTYTETGTGCDFSYLDSLTVDSLTPPVLLDQGFYCVGIYNDTVPLMGTPAGGTYSGLEVNGNNLIVVPDTIGTRYVYYTISNTCGTATDTAEYLVYEELVGTFPVSNPPICETDSVANFPLFSPGDGTYSTPYLLNNAFDVTAAGPGVHPVNYLHIDSVDGCISELDFAIVVEAVTPYTLIPDHIDSVCVGDTVTLSIVGPDSVYWTTPTADPYGTEKTFAVQGSTVIHVFNLLGCLESDSVPITVSMPQINAIDTFFCLEMDTLWLASTPGYSSYDWSFFTGQTETAFYVPTTPADESFTLTVTDQIGCTASTSVDIESDFCTGIPTITTAAKMAVYPNPASAAAWVEFDPDARVQHLQVHDALGRSAVVKPLQQQGQRYRLAGLKPGIYLITAVVNGQLSQKTLVIQ